MSDLILFVCFLINYFFRDLIEGCPLTVGRAGFRVYYGIAAAGGNGDILSDALNINQSDISLFLVVNQG